MDLEEPPLQAWIMMSSSMTLSLILNRQLKAWLGALRNLLAAAALYNEDIFIADGRL